MGFSPRVRAPRTFAHVRAWPESPSVGLQGIAGYKAGMTQVFLVDDRKNSITTGQEIVVPATIVEAPPLLVCAVRFYQKTADGLKTAYEVWAKELPNDIFKTVPKIKKVDHAKTLEKAEGLINEATISDIRVLTCTQPKKSNMAKKRPEIVEIRVGGSSIDDRWNYSKGLLGKEVKATDVFKEGQIIDVLAITKGKGVQGPVKRWGIKILPRKTRFGRRQVGAIGPWKPTRIMHTVPFSGQMGFHQRTEFNKRILKIGADGKEVTPKGGFLRYGTLKGDYILVSGSIPGTTKRLIQLRQAMRTPKTVLGQPNVTHISTASHQGA